MAEQELTFRVKAIDEASNVFPRIAQNARRTVQDVEQAGAIEQLKSAFTDPDSGDTLTLVEVDHPARGAC